MIFVLFFAFFAVGLALGGIAALSKSTIISVLILPLVLFALYLGFKTCFYFPSKAVNDTITLRQSFHMTKGYIWKLVATSFRAAFKLWLIMLVYLLLSVGLIVGLGTIMANGADSIVFTLAGFLLGLPVVLYFQPLLTIIGVTALSNYYQHALQNKGAS